MDEYKRFAWLYDFILYPAIKKVRRKITNIIKQYNAESVIDICCGTGDQLKHLRKMGFNQITGVDVSQSMLKQARKGKTQAGCENQDATNLSFGSNSFDAGIIGFALHEKPLPTAKKILEEAKRVIKPEGILIILDYNQEQNAPLFIRGMVHFVERFAGAEHYKNFRQYQKAAGLDMLMNNNKPVHHYKFHGGITVLNVYKN